MGKISSYSRVSTVTGEEILLGDQKDLHNDYQTKTVTINQIKDYVGAAVSGSISIPASASQIYYNSTYPTISDALDALLYVAPVITSFTGGGSYENGQTVTSLTFNWAYNKTITSQSINNGIGSLNAALRTYAATGLNLTSNTTYTLSATDGTTPTSSNTVVAFYNKRYWGTSASAAISDEDILAMDKEFSTSKTQTRIFDCTGGKYFYIIYPASWGLASFTVGGLSFSDVTLTTRSFVNASGYSASYNIYRCNNIQTGSAITVGVS